MSSTRNKQGKVTAEHLEEAARLRELWDAAQRDGRVGSQEAFGAAHGVGNQSAVGFFLNGKTALSMKAAVGFAKGLDCRIADFSPRLAKAAEDIANAAELAAVVSHDLGTAPDGQAPTAGEAHQESFRQFIVPPTKRWGDISMRIANVPAWFTLAIPDDALLPERPRGTLMIFERSTEGVAGKVALIEDKDGERHVRLFAAVRGGHWLARATGPGFVDMDSERDGLRVLAVARFRAE